jgi:hypothetical protein
MSETNPIPEGEVERPHTTPKAEYEPEADTSGVPKNFFIRCPVCRWARLSSGIASDLEDLNEIDANCVNCGKWRKFHCPNCGRPAMMKRLKGNKP